MTYEEIKKEIRDLGFEEDGTISEYNSIVANSVNRAVRFLCDVRPYVKKHTLTQDGTAEGFVEYDFAEELPDFYEFYEKPKYTENGERKTFDGYFIEGGGKLLVRGDFAGSVDFYYRAMPTRIDENTPGTYEMEIDRILHPLIPVLASYFVWLDDDERKATYYWNIYDVRKEELLNELKPTHPVTFHGGVSWHN